jgi:pantoate--beta-alanine ligase
MEITGDISAVRRHVGAARRSGEVVGFVPTMGALHAGHLSLIDAAGARSGYVAVSIFVNPTQFGPQEDLSAYPRTPAADAAACRSRGVDLLFTPQPQTMYPPGSATEVRVRALEDVLCGRSRPGHFVGVCTVVAKLLNIVQPDLVFFGAKDFQQSVIVRRMVADLNVPAEVVVCPTVREADGLAVSSRNAYLTPAERPQAPALYGALRLAAERIAASHPPAPAVAAAVREHLAARAPDGEIDYVEIVEPATLRPVETTDAAVLIALAVRFGRARLIDNILVDAPARRS